MYLYNTHVFRGSVVTFVSHCYCTYADPATALGSNNKNKNKEKIKMTKKKKNKKQSVTVARKNCETSSAACSFTMGIEER